MARRSFKRRAPVISYKKLFLIAVEGAKTEPAYFSMFNSREAFFRIKVPKSRNKSAPINVFEIAQAEAKKEGLREGDEVWIVVDHDNRTMQEIQPAHDACKGNGYEFAMSYPKFEYWLLLHFEDGHGNPSPADIDRRLKTHLPHFTKDNVETGKLRGLVATAIARAKAKDTPASTEWLQKHGSTVYKLVEKLT
jgi:hypothetical protein